MRRTLTILFALLFIAPGLSARSKSDWANVEKLKPGTLVQVLLWNGEKLRGRLDGADDAGLWLTKMDRRNIRGGPRANVDRASVRKVVRFRQPSLPDVGKWMFAGTLAGGVIGVVSGAIYDGIHHSNELHWLTGGLGGAGAGFFASCLVLTGVLMTEMVVEMIHPRTLVYEAQHTSSTQPNRAARHAADLTSVAEATIVRAEV